MSTQLGYDWQTAKFLATVAQNMPKGMTGPEMQYWIQNPSKVGLALALSFLRAPDHEFPTWTKIKLGTGLKTGNDFLIALLKQGHKPPFFVEDYLRESRDFTVARELTEIELVLASAVELGFTEKAATYEVYRQASRLGLDSCTAEVGPQLLLQYDYKPKTPEDCYLIAMEPVHRPICGGPSEIFLFGIGKKEPYLCSRECSGGWPCHPDWKFLFVKRRHFFDNWKSSPF